MTHLYNVYGSHVLNASISFDYQLSDYELSRSDLTAINIYKGKQHKVNR